MGYKWSIYISGQDNGATDDGAADATTTTFAGTRPTGSGTPREKKRKNTEQEKKESEAENAKRERSTSLLNALNRVGQRKEEEDKDTKFCKYICAQLQMMTANDRNEAHMQIFQVIMNITMNSEEERT